jgi:hypothetical protein
MTSVRKPAGGADGYCTRHGDAPDGPRLGPLLVQAGLMAVDIGIR